MIDRSPPVPGDVIDGDRLRKDRQYQSDDKSICAQWIDFHDPESGIDRLLWMKMRYCFLYMGMLFHRT